MNCEPTDPCYVYQGKLNMMSPSMVTVGSIKTQFSRATFEQRTKSEAIERAQEKLAIVNRTFRGVPFLRPYVFGLNLLTYGLILVDPLDRLE